MSPSPPLSARRSPEQLQAYATLIEGYPEHLHLAIDDWLYNEAGLRDDALDLVRVLLREFGIWRHKSFPDAFRPNTDRIASHVRGVMKVDVDFGLDLLDFIAAHRGDDARSNLERILHEGGSAYMVDPTGEAGLVRRVPDAAVDALRAALDTKSRAAEHLGLAWRQLYGRAPNASSAYREAVRAVEVLAGPAIIPNDPQQTLGKVIGVLRNAPQKLETVFTDEKAEGTRTAFEMMRLLWHAQHDRHGDADPEAPLHVSEDEARGAVHLAVLLVTWWHQGTLRGVP